MSTTIRRCAACGTRYHWNSRHPNRKFCSPRCKTRHWRSHSGGPTPPPAAGAPVAALGLDTASVCPSCRQPLTVVSILMPFGDETL
jgi:hypothetical protein